MCRVLVRWQDRKMSYDAEKDRLRSETRRGDPIVAMPDGHVWGSQEKLPTFVSLDMDGVPVDDIRKFIVSEESLILAPTGKPHARRKRAYNFQIDKLPKNIVAALGRDGFAQVSMADLSGRILHKESGLLR